jgi:hypothetical protein
VSKVGKIELEEKYAIRASAWFVSQGMRIVEVSDANRLGDTGRTYLIFTLEGKDIADGDGTLRLPIVHELLDVMNGWGEWGTG